MTRSMMKIKNAFIPRLKSIKPINISIDANPNENTPLTRTVYK
ncbi:hypothetical protein J14TS2_14050 [Bacillus sp. J14TS2]|nr:hypothetical protein J14TS2_14050 [Bacillus sp. J14TS2]